MEQLLATYGYPFLFVGTFLEGETPLLIASFMAHRGYLSLPIVILVAFAGSFSADQLFFHFGQTQGMKFLSKRPTWQPKVARINSLLERHGLPLVIGFRFLYGLRTAAPFAIGMSGFPRGRFLLLNAIGAILWAVVLSALGYSLGNVMSLFLEDVKRYELPVLIGLLLASAIFWLVYWRRGVRSLRSAATAHASKFDAHPFQEPDEDGGGDRCALCGGGRALILHHPTRIKAAEMLRISTLETRGDDESD